MRASAVVVLVGFWLFAAVAVAQSPAGAWSASVTMVKGCSCDLVCACYFGKGPTFHTGHGPICKSNYVYKINRGRHGATDLAGVKFWVATDSGGPTTGTKPGGFTIVHVDPAATPAQRRGVMALVGRLNGNVTQGRDAKIEWQYAADRFHAKLDGGKLGEVALKNLASPGQAAPVVTGVTVNSVAKHDGLRLMVGGSTSYSGPTKAQQFYYMGTSGFASTLEVSSAD